MLKKKNAVPEMQATTVVDREGDGLEMMIKAKMFNGRIYVFVSDSNQLGSSFLAKDALFYIQQLVDRFSLDTQKTEFYRHIYQETMGSLFGRFIVNWNNGSDPSYRFQMLTNVDDMVGVNKVLNKGEDVSLIETMAKRAAV